LRYMTTRAVEGCVFVARLTSADLRRSDPFVSAVVGYFDRFWAENGPSPDGLRGYLAGGLAVRCYAGSRATGDIDMFFTGARVLLPPNTTVTVSAGGREHALVFDHRYTPDFGLLHPDHESRAVDLTASGGAGFPLRVLHPVDLAITKVARFQDHDRADIEALARSGSFDAQALDLLGQQALSYAVGNLTFVTLNLRDAVELVARNQPARARSAPDPEGS
jgi:hypothetical protein